MARRILVIALKYGLGFAVFGFVVWYNWADISKVFDRSFRWPPFLLAVFLGMAGVFLTFVRWYVLVRALDLPAVAAAA